MSNAVSESVPPRKRYSPKSKLLLAAGAVLVSLAFAEAGARIWLAKFATEDQRRIYVLPEDLKARQRRVSPHPYLIYYPTPNYSEGKVSHNSLGYRGPEIPQPKPAGEFRIACLGGSTTYSTSVNDNGRMFTARLENELKENYECPGVRVVNAGAPGYTSWECLVNLEFRVLDLAPDLVILYEGVNDAHTRFVPPDSYRGDNTAYRKEFEIPPVRWHEHSVLARILERNLGWSAQVGVNEAASRGREWREAYRKEEVPPGYQDPLDLLSENPPVFYERNLRGTAAIARANGVKILFATFAYTTAYPEDYTARKHYQQAIAEHNQSMKQIAAELNDPLYDFAAEMDMDGDYWADGRHTNTKGDELKARLFAAFLEKSGLLAGARKPPE